ncbi:hypothetical protein TRVL_06273 [Trypanosoma vivax]|nr:hypothetical protein TRVL_06273 [Trypanosoma vivax]
MGRRKRSERPDEKEFVCPQWHHDLKRQTNLAAPKCETSSIINSEDSNVAEQSVTTRSPICSEGWKTRRLLRHMLKRRPGREAPLRPQTRVKHRRKGMGG